MRNKNIKYKKKSKAIPIMVTLVCMTAAAFAMAVVWQGLEEAPYVIAEHESRTSIQDGDSSSNSDLSSSTVDILPIPQDQSTVPMANIPSQASSQADASAPDNNTDKPELSFNPPREDFSYALPASEPVPLSYFDDAIFLGDSISTGILSYNLMSNTTVVAFTGIHTVNVLTKECIDTDEGRKTILSAAKDFGDKQKVYIMLGGNGLGYDLTTFIKGYSEFLDAVKEQYPNSIIYVQTMMPVTDYAHDTYPSVSNEVINEYNLAIQDLAKEKKVYLVDTANALMDANGKLPDVASPVDGMHFGPEYYLKWFDYLRSHTAP